MDNFLDSLHVLGYLPRLFPAQWGQAGPHTLTLLQPSEAHDIKAELGIPSNARAVTVTIQAPFGRKGYTYEAFATYDKPPSVHDADKGRLVGMPEGRWWPLPPLSLVIWRRCMYCHGIAAYIEARGDPRLGNTPISLQGLEKVEMGEAQRALRGLDLFKKIERRGRPPGSAFFQDANDFQAKVLHIMRELRRQGRNPTQEAVARYLNIRMSDRQLRTWLKQFHLSWHDLRHLARD